MNTITIIDGKGYIFNVDTLKLAREKYHVAGVLVGVLPQFPQQNIFGGLPLQLLPEELKYLLDAGDFELRDGKALHEELNFAPLEDTDPLHVVVPPNAEYTEKTSESRQETIKWTEPVAKKYHIFRYLVNKGYFIMPGLRFGCQFMAYPGDLMRYHSHYNVLGFDWNEQFNILDIINGGRLATSVKKCWVIGAFNPETEEEEVFSVEWAQFG